eukprot:TRINITY_DN6174_c0_g1_i1.p1 TRINITY_DN6174_c0_g1~~TRINITY_DN6174_c0_g1_i1.p1  ORF type:complete len:1014 (+),score=384.04 TRINITY_DN6174_c0_g1_i1:59-3043(+)
MRVLVLAVLLAAAAADSPAPRPPPHPPPPAATPAPAAPAADNATSAPTHAHGHHYHSEHINRDQRTPTVAIAVFLSGFLLWLVLRGRSRDSLDSMYRRLTGVEVSALDLEREAAAEASLALQRLPGRYLDLEEEESQPAVVAALPRAVETPSAEPSPPPSPRTPPSLGAVRARSPAPRNLRPAAPWRAAVQARREREALERTLLKVAGEEGDGRVAVVSAEAADRAPLCVLAASRIRVGAALDEERLGRLQVAQAEAAARGSAQAVESEWRCSITEREDERQAQGAALADTRANHALAVLEEAELRQLTMLLGLEEEDERQALAHEEGRVRGLAVADYSSGVTRSRERGRARRRAEAAETRERSSIASQQTSDRVVAEAAATRLLQGGLPAALARHEARARLVLQYAEGAGFVDLSSVSVRLSTRHSEGLGWLQLFAAAVRGALEAALREEGRERRSVSGAEAVSRAGFVSRHARTAVLHRAEIAEAAARVRLAAKEGADFHYADAARRAGAVEIAQSAGRSEVAGEERVQRRELSQHGSGLSLLGDIASLAAAAERARGVHESSEADARAAVALQVTGSAVAAVAAEETRLRSAAVVGEAEARASLLCSSAPALACAATEASESEERLTLARWRGEWVEQTLLAEHREARGLLFGAEDHERAGVEAVERAARVAAGRDAAGGRATAELRGAEAEEAICRGSTVAEEASGWGGLAAAEAASRVGPTVSDEASRRRRLVAAEERRRRALADERMQHGAAAAARSGAPLDEAASGEEREARARAELLQAEESERGQMSLPLRVVIAGAVTRSMRSIQSHAVRRLPKGTLVRVVELRGLRARIADGEWVSVESQSGQAILRPDTGAAEPPPPPEPEAEPAKEEEMWEVAVSKDADEKLGLLFNPDQHGILVREVRQGSAADRAGLQARIGQRLTHVNGAAVASLDDFVPFARETALVLRFAPPQSAFAAAARRSAAAAAGAGKWVTKGLGLGGRRSK